MIMVWRDAFRECGYVAHHDVVVVLYRTAAGAAGAAQQSDRELYL